MAVYKLNSNKKRSRQSQRKKTIGFSLIFVATLIFLFMTGIVPPVQKFFLGLFGVFGFVGCLLTIVVGLAFLNQKKYVMPNGYLVCLILVTVFLLCILQLIVVGGKGVLADGTTREGFWSYLGKNFSKTWTPGGLLIGIVSSALLYTITFPGAIVASLLAIGVCATLLVVYLNKWRKENSTQTSLSLQMVDNHNDIDEKVAPVEEKTEKQEEVNVVLNGKLHDEEEKEKVSPVSARTLLGLDKKRNTAYEFEKKEENDIPKKETVDTSHMTTREKLFGGPAIIDVDEYFKSMRRGGHVEENKEEIQQNINALKNENNDQINPRQTYVEDEFIPEQKVEIRRTLKETSGEALVDEANTILQTCIEEEKQENPELYSNPQNETNQVGDRFTEREAGFDRSRLGDRNDGFSERDDRLSRDNSRQFGIRQTGGEPVDNGGETSIDSVRTNRQRNLEDEEINNAYTEQLGTINQRNGSGSLTNEPLEKEVKEEPYRPYIYIKPSLDFITTRSVDLSIFGGEVARKRVALENSLEMFGVPAKVQNVVIGPAVTRYELEMPQGTPVGKIKTHIDDIAYALAADGAIRVEAPVPGKSIVGIEVPNEKVATVSLRDLIDSSEFRSASSPLTFAIGKDITGNVICADMKKLTHLLVAGTTGSGKSVCLNSIILSILYKASPEDVRIALVDPKRVEFSNYEGMPHLITPKIVCDTQRAINLLNWAVEEMEKRFSIMGLARVKSIDEFNQTPDVVNHKIKKMPYLVIIIDELSDLMMNGKKEVEDGIVKLAQKARAAGIHLILATQRPSREVVTGLIKSNIPSKISFSVSSLTNSMIVLDRGGAEKLLGRGDMMYYPNGAKDAVRVQGGYVGTNEINTIVDFVRDNNEPIFDKEIEEQIENPNKSSNNAPSGRNNKMDELLPQVLKMCIESGTASGTMIRRKFQIGYPRAATILDQMEEAGYISSSDGVKPRSVYITPEEFRDIFGDVTW